MTSKNERNTVSLNLMVGAAIIVWACTFASLFGPFVFGYVAMHALTTGIFLLAIRRSDRRHARPAVQPALSSTGQKVAKPATERIASPQPAA